MATISPDAALAIWGIDSPLFQKYHWRRRLSQETHEPIPEPVSEFREALVILYKGYNDRTERLVKVKGRLPDGAQGPMLCVQIFSSGYTKDLFTREYEFPLAPEVLEQLKRAGILSGRKYWGGTDMDVLSLNEDATDVILEECRKFRLEQEAEAAKTPAAATEAEAPPADQPPTCA